MCETNSFTELPTSTQRRIEIVLKLTRRIDLLEDLMRSAREKRCLEREQALPIFSTAV